MEDKISKNLDKFYKEFKEYENYFINYNEEQLKVIPEKIKEFLKDDASKEKAFDFMFDIKAKPIMMGSDLNLLKERLIAAYEVIENLGLDIPQDIKTDLEKLKQAKDGLQFAVKLGQLYILDQDRHDAAVKNFKRPEYLKMFLDEVKHLDV